MSCYLPLWFACSRRVQTRLLSCVFVCAADSCAAMRPCSYRLFVCLFALLSVLLLLFTCLCACRPCLSPCCLPLTHAIPPPTHTHIPPPHSFCSAGSSAAGAGAAAHFPATARRSPLSNVGASAVAGLGLRAKPQGDKGAATVSVWRAVPRCGTGVWRVACCAVLGAGCRRPDAFCFLTDISAACWG